MRIILDLSAIMFYSHLYVCNVLTYKASTVKLTPETQVHHQNS